MVAYFSLSNLIVDDILLWDGRIHLGVLGGAGPHALAGMRVWGGDLGLVATAGKDLQPEQLAQLERLGIDFNGLIQDPMKETARAWQIFQPDEQRIEVFRDQTLSSKSTPAFHLIPAGYRSAKGMHLYWDGKVGDLDDQISWLRSINRAIRIVWEPATGHLHEDKAHFEKVLPKVDLFSPNLMEGSEITGEVSPLAMIETLIRWGAPLAAIRMGEQGSLVGDRAGNIWRIPVYVKHRVDVTGAGNAYCGGFLLGWLEAEDIAEAASMAAVSASFAIEQFGLPEFEADLVKERQKRREKVRSGIEMVRGVRKRLKWKGQYLPQREHMGTGLPFDTITADLVREFVESITNTHAPGQTIQYTRTPVIQKLFNKRSSGKATFIPNYLDTGNAVVYFGNALPESLFFAHADEVSYLVGDQQEENFWNLIPYCKHLSMVSMPAVGLRYAPEEKGLRQVACGMIVSRASGAQVSPYFRLKEGELRPGDRVVFHHPISYQTQGLITGSIDNAAGVAACLLAAIALSHLDIEVRVGFVFSDEEEGPPEQMQSFAKGVRRLLRRISPPRLCFVVDGQSDHSERMGKGALFAESSGNGSGNVTPPHLFSGFINLVEEMKASGIKLHANHQSVSRGDETALMEATPNIILLGYPSRNRHFDYGPGQASLADLTHLTKSIFWLALQNERMLTRHA